MNRNVKIIPLLIFLLTSCNSNYYDGYLIINNINPSISYINEYRINSNYDYLIPIKSNLSLFKGNAALINMDIGKESSSYFFKGNTLKNTNYLLTISFEEDFNLYYFDEYVIFENEVWENYKSQRYFVITKYDELYFSNILLKIF